MFQIKALLKKIKWIYFCTYNNSTDRIIQIFQRTMKSAKFDQANINLHIKVFNFWRLVYAAYE